ncbi:MAG TPA: hypothetical protein VF783_26375, partial [Terriglobales bacterium]
MRRICTFAAPLFLLFSIEALFGQNQSCTNPADIPKMVNPVRPTAESLAQGKKYYGYDCLMCHGQSGNGKG